MRGRIPATSAKKKSPNFKRIILEQLADLRKDINRLNREIRQICHEEADKALESKIPVIEGQLALKEANLVKRMLIEKGIIDEKEYLERFKGGK